MTKRFQRELEKIKKMILALGAVVESQVRLANKALDGFHTNIADTIIQSDLTIDEMEVEVEEECLKVMALHQPVAADLRFIVAVIKINNDLERIGDETVNIAERIKAVSKEAKTDLAFDYGSMIAQAEIMLKLSLDALIHVDLEAAFKVLTMDDDVDEVNQTAHSRIGKAIHKNPDQANNLLDLLLISCHVERIADHTTNIAEEVIYMIEGDIVRHGNL